MGVTRSELAALAGVSERLVASLELGDAKGIRLDKLLSICDAAGLGLCMEPKALANAAAKDAASEAIAATPPNPSSKPSYDNRLQQFIIEYAFNPRPNEGEQPWRN